MAKNSFLLHNDSLLILDELTDIQAGKLIKAIFNYQREIETTLDPLTKVAFIPFRNQFLRDKESYSKTVEKNKTNIDKRWGKNNTKNTSGKNGISKNTKHTDNDNDNDNDNKNEKDNEIIKSVCDFFKFSEQSNFSHYQLLNDFIKILKHKNQLDQFEKYFIAYKKIKHDGKFVHKFKNFTEAGWNEKNWPEELKQLDPLKNFIPFNEVGKNQNDKYLADLPNYKKS